MLPSGNKLRETICCTFIFIAWSCLWGPDRSAPIFLPEHHTSPNTRPFQVEPIVIPHTIHCSQSRQQRRVLMDELHHGEKRVIDVDLIRLSVFHIAYERRILSLCRSTRVTTKAAGPEQRERHMKIAA